MPTLDTIPPEVGPVHLLLVAPSKAGKSTYCAEAALDGFELIYVDADNGLSALRYRLKDNKEAMSRVDYHRTTKPDNWLKGVLRSTSLRPFYWRPGVETIWTEKMNLADDDPVQRFDITKVPKSAVFVIDSWTSLASDALEMFRPGQAAPLLDGVDQSIYGQAKSICDFLCNIIQGLPFHVIVQAHAGKYEIYEKPVGVLAGQAKQKDMKLIDSIDIPVSSSRQAGFEMGKRFNHIGWLSMNNLGSPTIDFTRKANRVGGGPPNREAKTTDLSFKKLVEESAGIMPEGKLSESGWCIELSHKDMVAFVQSQKKT